MFGIGNVCLGGAAGIDGATPAEVPRLYPADAPSNDAIDVHEHHFEPACCRRIDARDGSGDAGNLGARDPQNPRGEGAHDAGRREGIAHRLIWIGSMACLDADSIAPEEGQVPAAAESGSARRALVTVSEAGSFRGPFADYARHQWQTKRKINVSSRTKSRISGSHIGATDRRAAREGVLRMDRCGNIEARVRFGSCAALAQRSRLASFEEVAISTGKQHGAFFEPRPEWINPLKVWIVRASQ